MSWNISPVKEVYSKKLYMLILTYISKLYLLSLKQVQHRTYKPLQKHNF